MLQKVARSAVPRDRDLGNFRTVTPVAFQVQPHGHGVSGVQSGALLERMETKFYRMFLIYSRICVRSLGQKG
jgi:hypothetical protein